MKKKIKFILTIAGSDPSGGAGIQSDLKTFHNHGLYGLSVITSVTAQNTGGVQKTYELPADVITSQLKSLFDDFDIRVVKTGMLSSEEVVNAVSIFIKKKPGLKLIIDPVFRSKNGYELLNKEGINLLKKKLIPLSFLVTPNLFEGEILSGIKAGNIRNIEKLLLKIYNLGCMNVLLKGGHFHPRTGIEKGIDIWFDGRKFHLYSSKFVDTKNTHGIGCTFSAAIAANIANGLSLKDSITKAKAYVVESLLKSRKIGKGYGPVEQV
jgi:hydroxymethylpyrimidine/phosphomethylpyrimidine kinase